MTTHPHHPRTDAAWPRQLRLPGQAAAPEGPVDLTMMYAMHHAFRRDLTAFAETVAVTPVEDRDAWRALAERWELFSLPLHHHHHGEDTWLWPLLLQRVEAAERATLQAMEDEHARIDPGLEACAAGFARLADHADPDARAALAVRVTAVREQLGRHLHHEETETLALLQRVLTDAEWREVDEHFKEGLSFGQIVRLVPWVLHGMPRPAREHLLRHTGAAYRVVWWVGRPRFERLERRAFRHRR